MTYQQKIALYGLSVETKQALKKYSDYEIVGLLDAFKTEGEMFGKPIVSMDKALEAGITGICVVARPGSSKAIARRIKDICLKHNIALWDIRGKDLINDTKEIYSVAKMMDQIRDFAEEPLSSTSSKIKFDLFSQRITKLFTDANSRTKACFVDPYDIGYLFCAPVVTDFAIWFDAQVKQHDISNVWYVARDGYLVKKLCNMLNYEKGVYFLTSRTAVIRSTVKTDADLEYIEGMIFSGNLQDNMKTRFGINISEEEADGQGIKKYKEEIFNRAKRFRENYLKYISKINCKSGDIAFFDFVSKGTTQFFLQRLVPDNHVKGFYFLQPESDYMKNMGNDIKTFYSKEEVDSSEIFDNYYILETILTSSDPSVLEFDELGNPVFANETRTEDAIKCSKRIQEGILDYFKDYIQSCKEGDREVDKRMDEVFLKLMHNVEFQNEDFLSLVIEDPFFNRITNITDIL